MQGENFSTSALIVLGHGTELNPNSGLPAKLHAAELRRRRLFRDVHEAYWKQEPQLKSVLANISAPRIFIAPLFISEGYFSTEIIPQELGFTYPTCLKLTANEMVLHYCRPVGTHDAMTGVILARAAEVIHKFPFPRPPRPADLTLFIAGHGTGRNRVSRQAIERQAELIRARKIYAGVHHIFMEEEPRIGDCYSLAQTKHIIVVPFFISDGLHAVEDIPVLLGEPATLVKERLAAGQPTWRNPTEKHGKLVWYTPSVGTAPLLAEVILARVHEATHQSSSGL